MDRKGQAKPGGIVSRNADEGDEEDDGTGLAVSSRLSFAASLCVALATLARLGCAVRVHRSGMPLSWPRPGRTKTKKDRYGGYDHESDSDADDEGDRKKVRAVTLAVRTAAPERGCVQVRVVGNGPCRVRVWAKSSWARCRDRDEDGVDLIGSELQRTLADFATRVDERRRVHGSRVIVQAA